MPSDTADKLDYDKAADISKLMGLIARSVAASHELPASAAIAAPKNQGRK
mgnify:CR=1 FL=1